MDTKITGYSILTVGLLVIIFAGINVYQIFTGNAEPISIFDFPSVELSASALLGPEVPTQNDSKVELLPGDILSETTNLIAHLFLMGFMVNIGSKIANVGVYMLRPIKVNLKTENEEKIQTK